MASLKDIKVLEINTTCPWCMRKGGTVPVTDCAHVKHFFHEKCDKQHRAWLRRRGQEREDWKYNGKVPKRK